MPRIKIFQISHVPIAPLNRNAQFPVIAVSNFGQHVQPDNHLLFSDRLGQSIAQFNDDFSELTAHYWVWRNMEDLDYVGFFHHRRFFNFSKPLADNYPKVLLPGYDQCVGNFCTSDQAEAAIRLLDFCDILTIRAEHNKDPLDLRWPSHHVPEVWEVLKDVLRRQFGFLKADAFFALNRRLVWYPIFVTRWETFCSLIPQLFDILFRVRAKVNQDKAKYGVSQPNSRYLAYLSEPIMMLLINHLRLSSQEVQLISSEDDRVPTSATP